jgi:hypothetical protein
MHLSPFILVALQINTATCAVDRFVVVVLGAVGVVGVGGF